MSTRTLLPRPPDGHACCMTTHSAPRVQSAAASRSRALGFARLAAGALVALPAVMLLLLSDQKGVGPAGPVMLALVASAVALGAAALATPGRSLRPVSLGLSGVWLVAAVLLYPTQPFAADAVWVAGAVALGALVTAVAAWRAR